jgi:di/tricarboxylate transporter
VIFMLAGVLSMGLALEKTGAAALIAHFITHTAGSFGPHIVLSMFFFITFMATNVMSNNASAALLAPVAIVTAQAMQVSERPFLLAVTFAASLSFMTPMGYQTNTMIYGPGNYRFVDYLKVGTPLNILLWILASILIPLYFPF